MVWYRAITIILSAATVATAQPAIGPLTVDGTGRSTARVSWTTTGATPTTHRVRWGTSPSYTGGTVEWVTSNTAAYIPLSGMPSGTTIHVCAESSSNSGATWSPCGTTTFATVPAGAIVPAVPTLPETWNSTYPDTTACTTRAVLADCSNLQSQINAAVAAQASACQVVSIPKGAVCIGNYTTPTDPAVRSFTAADVNTGSDTITIASHPWVPGDRIRFAKAGCLPGSSPGVPDAFCQLRGPIVMGRVYYVATTTVNTITVSATSGGPIINLTDQGSGTNYAVPWPPTNSNEVIIRSAANDDELPPPHTRIWSLFRPHMATLQVTGGTYSFPNVAFRPGVGAHHIRLVGLDISHTDASANLTGSIDPRPTFGLLDFPPDHALGYITLDRVSVRGLGYPNRLYRPLTQWDGAYMAIQNSDLTRLDTWRPGRSGFAVSFGSQTATIAAGTATLRAAAPCTASSAITATRTGGAATVTARAWATIDCTPTIAVEPGVSATCTGEMLDPAGLPRPCQVINMSPPEWPRDAFGGFAALPLAEITAAAGIWASAYDPYGYAPSAYYTEGTQGFIAGWGPGPFKFENNHMSGVGLLPHFDDSSAGNTPAPPPPSNYTIRRNRFVAPDELRSTGPSGLRYMQRNSIEWKNGTRGLIEGNMWQDFWADVSSTGCAITLTPIGTAAQISDFTIRYNTINNSSCFMLAIGGIIHFRALPFERLAIHDNVINNNNGYTRREPQARATSVNFPFYLGWAMGDVRIANNTLINNRGPVPEAFHHLALPVSNVVVENNVLWMNNDSNAYNASPEFAAGSVPFCTGVAKALFDCAWTTNQTPSYIFRRNVTVPFYTNSQTDTGLVSFATTTANYSGLDTYTVDGADHAARIAALKFRDYAAGDYQWKADSPYTSGGASPGVKGMQVGANIAKLTAAQGRPTNARWLRVSSSSARVYFAAPDTTGCPVDLSTDPASTTWTRFANAGGVRLQNVLLTSLSPGVNYYARIMCAAEQPVLTIRL